MALPRRFVFKITETPLYINLDLQDTDLRGRYVMKRLPKNVWLSIVMLLFACGCMAPQRQPAAKTDYYTLEYVLSGMTQKPASPAVLGIQQFQISPEYNTNKMIYRENQFERNHYHYHKWRANPADLCTYFIARDLEHSKRFKAVFTLDRKVPVTHRLEGVVEEFFEYDTAQGCEAVFSLSVTLLKSAEPDISRRILFQRRYNTRSACRQKNPSALAEAMSLSIKQASAGIISDIYDAVTHMD